MSARRVLVIDDSPTIHKVIEHTLKRLGHEVIHVRDGQSGVAKAIETHPHAILLDFMMPGMNGYQVCKALSEQGSLEGVPVVLMSAKGEMMGEKLVRTMGIVDFITKPFSPEGLATVIQHVLETYGRPDSRPPEVSRPPLVPVGERKPEDLPTSLDLSDPRGRVALRGNLGMVPAAEVFQLLKFQSHTGILHIARGAAHIEFFMRDGAVAYARADKLDEEFLLGRFLVEGGAITARDLEMFLENRKGTSRLIGEQLVKLGHLTQEQLNDAIGRQTAELVYETVRWGEGEFAFYVSENLPVEAREAGLSFHVDGLLMEGFRRVDEWGQIEKEIRDFDIVLAPSRDATGVIKKIRLEPEEERMLALVDGSRCIREVIRVSRRGSFEVCKILFRLLSARIIRKRSAAGDEGGQP
ncbi:MAG TPA: response regulator [Myxococcota bacterium]|nr:response regulator [Myxococcota bacterium]HRY96407.1 response regulator [Myxococcota bacterium]HSA22499.1 response regulator [Myxococcota bacterium]